MGKTNKNLENQKITRTIIIINNLFLLLDLFCRLVPIITYIDRCEFDKVPAHYQFAGLVMRKTNEDVKSENIYCVNNYPDSILCNTLGGA